MSTESCGLAFISLLRDEVEARGLAGLLEGLARPAASVPAAFLTPDVRGLDFFADQASQAAIDRWWAAAVAPDATPVYLLSHEPGLAGWLRGLDGIFVVAADAGSAGAYAQCMVVDAGPGTAPLALGEAVIRRFGISVDAREPSEADVFDRRDARIVSRLRADAAAQAATPPAAAGAGTEPGVAEETHPPAVPPPLRRPALPPLFGGDDVASRARPDPFELLVADSERGERDAPAWVARSTPRLTVPRGLGPKHLRQRLPLVGPRHGADPEVTELAALLVARAPTIVVIGSRKGGVGKTSHAAGIAIVAGTALDSVGHRAALVDANIANPDAWGQLDLPPGAATVRDLATALAAGTEPPAPIHASTPALACYPERRDGVEYSRTDIRRLAHHLRSRFTFVVVDMSNRLPDPMSGPEAAAAAYWLEEADALVLPTASSRQDFNGVLDYLDVQRRPPTVVPCIVSNARRNRRHPMTRQYLDVITARVDRVVQMPDAADSVRLAGMEGVPVQEVSPRLRAAYRELTDAVARLPLRARA